MNHTTQMQPLTEQVRFLNDEGHLRRGISRPDLRRRHPTLLLPSLTVAVLLTAPLAHAEGRVTAWGNNMWGQTNVPATLSNVVAIAAGAWHGLALRADGTVAGWGYNLDGRATAPANLSNAVAVAAGAEHSLALLVDGTVTAWGNPNRSPVPTGLGNVVSIGAGTFHSLALRDDGTVVAWGYNNFGETNVPADLSNVVAVAAGGFHSLALRGDGTVAAWGWNAAGQTNVPAGLNNVVAVAAGGHHSLALRANGTVAAWGANNYGQNLVNHGQTNVPTGLSDVVAVAAGGYHSLALRANGIVLAWGDSGDGQTNVPPGLSNVVALGAAGVVSPFGGAYSLALSGSPEPNIYRQPVSRTNDVGTTAWFEVAATGLPPMAYQWQFNGTNLSDGARVSGATSPALAIFSVQASDAGSYSVLVTNAYGFDTSEGAELSIIGSSNLLLNGSFELPAIPANTTQQTIPTHWGTTGSPWYYVFNGDGGFSGVMPFPQEGQQFADIANESDRSIFQTFEITKDGRYVVRWFDSAGHDAGLTTSPYSMFLTTGAAEIVASNRFDAFHAAFGTWMPREVGLSLLPGTYTLHFRAEGIAGGLDSLLDNVSLELLSDVALVRIVDYYPLPLDAQWIYQGFDWDGAPAKSIRRVDATNTSIMLYTGRSPVTSYTTNVVSEYNAYLNPTTMMPYDEWISYMAGGSHFGYFGDAGAGDIRLDGGGVLPEFMTVGSSLTNMVDAYIAGTFVGSVSLVVQLLERASLTVPAGSFTDVLRVRIAIGTPGGTEVHDEWWARGVGSIKEEGISGDGVLERWELIEYAVPLPPVITAQPASRTNAVGSAATFCVSTTSSAPLSYQWRFNNTDLTNGGRLSGVTSPCLVISGLRTNDAGDYTVVVTNVFGSVTSAVANLTVVPAAQFDPDLYLTNAIVLPDGRAQLEVVVPSNGVYSLLMSTNLVDWESVENLEGPTNRFIIVGPDPPTRLSDFNTLFLRAAVGLVPQYQLHFDFNDTAGTLVPGTPSVSFPQSIRSYFAFLEVNRIANPAADTEVFFTGPPGSGFTNAPPFGSRVDADHYGKNYWTATLTTPPEPPPGDWTVDYAGAALKFEGIDPQARFVIPQPTVIVSNGLLTSVSWVYRNATTGEPLAEAPMFVTAVNVQLFGGTPPQSLYDSNGLGREDTQFTFSPAFLWADVSALEITYEDESGNAYVITYAK